MDLENWLGDGLLIDDNELYRRGIDTEGLVERNGGREVEGRTCARE